jgi:hypothetical protein
VLNVLNLNIGVIQMLELLMAKPRSQDEIPTPDVLFLWDPVQATDLMGSAATIAYVGTGTVDPAYLIDGVGTISFPATSAGATITFETPLDFTGMDWTIEWSSFNTNAPTTYASEFAMYSGLTGNGILARYGDTGFGHRLQFGNKFAAATDAYNINANKTGLANTLNRYALVCKSNVITVFRNGVKQPLANGTGGVYNLAGFAAGAVTDLRAIRLGYLNSSVPALLGNHGRIRICRNALYTNNYTPTPF